MSKNIDTITADEYAVEGAGRRWVVTHQGAPLTEVYKAKRLAEVAAQAMRDEDATTHTDSAGNDYVPTAGELEQKAPVDMPGSVEWIAALTHEERVVIARAEYLAVKAAGSDMPTPVLDWMTNPETAPRPATKSARQPRGTVATFDASVVTEHTCSCCATVKPVKAFPTVNGPEVRSVRCRACRDAKACE